jgi:hypothetical protein
MLALLLLVAPALTIDLGFNYVGECPSNLSLELAETFLVGNTSTFNISSDARRIDYAVVDETGEMIQYWKQHKGKAAFKPTKASAGKQITIIVNASSEGCPVIQANATVFVASMQKKSASAGPRLPATITVIPWLIAGIGALLAGALVWRR